MKSRKRKKRKEKKMKSDAPFIVPFFFSCSSHVNLCLLFPFNPPPFVFLSLLFYIGGLLLAVIWKGRQSRPFVLPFPHSIVSFSLYMGNPEG